MTHYRTREMVARMGLLDAACGERNVYWAKCTADPEFVTCARCKEIADAEVVIRHTKQLKARRWVP